MRYAAVVEQSGLGPSFVMKESACGDYVLFADIEKYEKALKEIADLPEIYISGKYAHEWLLSNPTRHAVTYELVRKAKAALA